MKHSCAWYCAATLIVFFLAVSPALAGVAEILSVSGKGKFRAQSESAWLDARIKQALDAGNFVRTGDLSAMAILLKDKTQMRLAQNSMLQIKEVPDQGETILELNAGRIWSQTKRKFAETTGNIDVLTVRTFNAFIGIRGTDWELEVDGERTRLTVLHGEVEIYNEFGSKTVRNNEQAIAEKGKAPVKMQLLNPAERIQWVTSFSVDANRYRELDADALSGDSEESAALRDIASLIRSQNLMAAHKRLKMMEGKRLASGVTLETVH